MDYLALKHFHMSCAAFSGVFFMLRGGWMLLDSDLLTRRWVRTLPHLVDSLLLASAIGLAAWSAQYPFDRPWLTAKVVALVAYIVLGTLALKGATRTLRTVAYLAALSTFGYIAAVAVTKNPLPFT
ncbi:MAG TPA: SirB2 family protein [Telluria sp.]|nr:SirB2 family protein [Telluria sp.]